MKLQFSPGGTECRLVIFDAFNTLLRPVSGHENTFIDALRDRGIDADVATMAHLQAASSGLAHHEWSGSRSAYVRWTAETLRELSASTVEAVAGNVVPALEQWHQAPMEIFPDVLPCLTGLRARGIMTAVCSNWGWDLRDDICGAGMGNHLDLILSSAHAGCRKPDSDIYRKISAMSGIEPCHAFFVGDNLEADIRGPQRSGISAVMIDRAGISTDECDTIASLEELSVYLWS